MRCVDVTVLTVRTFDFFFFNDTATTEIYTLSLHDALPISYMARNVVLCLDGTSNQYAATNTNVVKLYAMLDRARNDQLSYYQPGIGTFPPPGAWGRVKRWVATRLDLAIAWLLSEHVTDAYRFLMRYYQEGDSIFIFGFSRGALKTLEMEHQRLTPTFGN